MRKDAGRRALRYGVAASILAHLLLVALNPEFTIRLRAPARTPVLVPAERLGPPRPALPGDEHRDARATPVPATGAAEAARDSTRPGIAGVERASESGSAPRIPGAVERLSLPRSALLFRVPETPAETREQRAVRETRERLAAAAREPAARPEWDRYTPLGRVGGVEVIAGNNGDLGVRLPFGKKPPPPAQVVAPPARIATLAVDSVRHRGGRTYAHSGAFAISLPQRIRSGAVFDLAAHFPGPVDSARVRVYIDGFAAADSHTVDGVATASLSIGGVGEHRILIQFFGSGYGPAQLAYGVRVDG